jgi:drug/metabolite transporter (DMT)-like permease
MTLFPEGPGERHPSKASAGGFFIFAGLIIGSIAGIVYGQPSLGMVAGFGAGILIALAIWLLDRRQD